MTHTPDRTPFAARYPLMLRAGIALVLMGITRLVIAFGWIPREWDLTEQGVEQLLDAVYLAWAWFSSQRKVTPVADPRDNYGRPLVTQGRVERP